MEMKQFLSGMDIQETLFSDIVNLTGGESYKIAFAHGEDGVDQG